MQIYTLLSPCKSLPYYPHANLYPIIPMQIYTLLSPWHDNPPFPSAPYIYYLHVSKNRILANNKLTDWASNLLPTPCIQLLSSLWHLQLLNCVSCEFKADLINVGKKCGKFCHKSRSGEFLQ